MPKVGFHGHVEEAYLRFIEKKLKEKRAAMGINPLIRDIYVKVESREAKSGAPLSPILSPYGLNVGDFVSQFNKKSEESEYGPGVKIPTLISVFENKTLKFSFTTLYSYYILSNNNNKYRAIKFTEMYKKFLMVAESKIYGSKKLWSTPHELYSKTEIKALNYFFISRRKFNRKKQKRQQKKEKKEIVLKIYNITLEGKELFKNVLTTLQGNRLLLYIKLQHFLKGNKFKPEVEALEDFEDFISSHNNIVLGNYNKQHKDKYKVRFYKLKNKYQKNLTRWCCHRLYFKILREKKKKMRDNLKFKLNLKRKVV